MATEVLDLVLLEPDVLASDWEGMAPCSARHSLLSDRESVADMVAW